MTATLQDVTIMAGLGLAAVGLWMHSVPLALTVVGGLMLVGGVWARVRRERVAR